MVKIRLMNIKAYNRVYDLWLNTPGMGLNLAVGSKEGINETGNRVLSGRRFGIYTVALRLFVLPW